MTQLAIANEEVGHSFAGMIVTEAGVHPNGSVASIWPRTDDFRSPPINGHHYRASGCLKCARSGNCAPSQTDYVAVTEIVLCNVLGLIPPSPRLLTIGQLMYAQARWQSLAPESAR